MLNDTRGHPRPSPSSGSPPITALMQHHGAPGLNTIRQTQQLPVDHGMVEIRHGVGFFALRADPLSRPVERPRRAPGGARRDKPRGLDR